MWSHADLPTSRQLQLNDWLLAAVAPTCHRRRWCLGSSSTRRLPGLATCVCQELPGHTQQQQPGLAATAAVLAARPLAPGGCWTWGPSTGCCATTMSYGMMARRRATRAAGACRWALPCEPRSMSALSATHSWQECQPSDQLCKGLKHLLVSQSGCACCCRRCWQGSNDLQHWLDLRRHADDTTIRLPGQYGSWPVSGPAACMPFRAFRLLLTGPTQVRVRCILCMSV
jgi:hypothetical protein